MYEWSDIDELREAEDSLSKTNAAITRAEARKAGFENLIVKHEKFYNYFSAISADPQNTEFQRNYAEGRGATHAKAILDFKERISQIEAHIAEQLLEKAILENLVDSLKILAAHVEKSQLMNNNEI